MKLKTLKIYIKTLLEIEFIWGFKSLADIFILFDEQRNGSL